jgi:hypothetical protein
MNMRATAIVLLIATGIFAGTALGAEKRDPAPAPAPAPTPGDSDYCTRRDISPEDYAKHCVTDNGPAHRPVYRKDRVQPKSGTR